MNEQQHPIAENDRRTVRPVSIMAVSGSLRAVSSNTSLLEAAALLAPPNVTLTLYDGLGGLPHFNPDLDTDEPPPAVTALRARLRNADALLICSPEYAHGVPGVLKNALDWLVSSDEIVGKPTAALNAAPRAVHAQAALLEILSVMSARIVHEACLDVPLTGRKLDAAGIAADTEISALLKIALAALDNACRNVLS